MMLASERRPRLRTLAFLLLLPLAAAAGASAADKTDFDVTLRGVELRPGVAADIHYKVFVNEASACEGRVILAVHGVAHTAASFQPLAESLFVHNPAGRKVCQVVAVDLPGHGGSGLPTGGLLFGDLMLGDYVTVLRASLQRLPRLGIRPDTLLGHSQGGLVIQMTQQALRSEGSSLRDLHVKDVVLMASVGPQGQPWSFLAFAPAILSAFLSSNSTLGTHVAIPDVAWPFVFFAPGPGQAPVGAPAPEDVARYNSPEPLLSSLELLGFPPFERPVVDPGVFAPENGTALQVIAHENDYIVRPDESRLLYEHLTGFPATSGVAIVPGPRAVHDMYVSEPAEVLDAIAGTVSLP